MSTPTNHWKLGLFVLSGAALAVLSVVVFSSRSMQKETVGYTSYFDEAVTGLEVGSPISFRGVTIGHVEAIGIAPDRRHVEVSYDLTVPTLQQLGLAHKQARELRVSVPSDVRVQIAAQGVTGVKYVKLDFFENAPIEPLPFEVPEHNIPAMPSTLKNLEQVMSRSMDRVPEILDAVARFAERADRLMASLEGEGIPAHASGVLLRADKAFSRLDQTLADLDAKGVAADTRRTLASIEALVGDGRTLLGQVSREGGVLSSVQRASDAVGDVAVGARGTSERLEVALERVSDMASSVQRVADALEQEPDMLVKGRARSSSP